MALYTVKAPLNHDGIAHAVGDLIDLGESYIESLRAAGVIEAVAVEPVAFESAVVGPSTKKPGKK